MPRWYYSTNGKAEGPVTPDFLIESLKTGKFTLVDLVFKEGESAWTTFGEVPEFRDAFKAPVKTDASVSKRDVEITSVADFQMPEQGWPSDWRLTSSWIVLRTRSDASGYDQDGPFTAEHIIEMIGAGKINYSQYCWKPGYTRWFRIGNLPEFDRRKRDRENDPVNQIVPLPSIHEDLPALSREELLANVERLRRPKAAPAENLGKNLVGDELTFEPPPVVVATASPAPAQAQPPPAPVKPVAQIIEPRIIAADLATTVSPTAAKSTKPASTSRGLRFAVAAFVAGVFVIAMVTIMSAMRKGTSVAAPTLKMRARQPTSAQPVAPPKPPPAPKKAMIEPPAPQVATVLEIVPLKLETSGPSLAFQTNAGLSETIKVILRARSGDILKYASYSKSFDVTRSGGELPTLDLTKYSLPSGTYTVVASVGSLETSKQVFIGQRDAAFTNSLERHLKSLSYRQQLERTAVFYGSMKLEKSTKNLLAQSQALKSQPQKWKAAFESWTGTARAVTAQVASLAHAPVWEVAYPEQLAEFSALSGQLEAKAAQINEAMNQKRDLASVSRLDAVLNSISHLRSETARLSGRPQVSND